MSDPLETRLRAVEFLLAHLISRVRDKEDIEADLQDLRRIAAEGNAWKLLPEFTHAQAKDVVETAAELLEDAQFQAGADGSG